MTQSNQEQRSSIPTVTCSCGRSYPHHTHQGPANFCPYCGRTSAALTMSDYYAKVLANRRVTKGRRVYLSARILMR